MSLTNMNLIAKINQSNQENVIGRIGGNIPLYFLDKIDEINNYNFYLSFQNPEKKEEYISIFIPQDYDEMIDRNIYPNCAIKIFCHVYSEESNNKEYTIKSINKTAIIGYQEVDNDNFDFITKSKKPRLIQDEDYYFKYLENDNYSFFMQIDEDYYPDNLIKENYIFGYGVLYLYIKRETNSIIAGFWQYS